MTPVDDRGVSGSASVSRSTLLLSSSVTAGLCPRSASVFARAPSDMLRVDIGKVCVCAVPFDVKSPAARSCGEG